MFDGDLSEQVPSLLERVRNGNEEVGEVSEALELLATILIMSNGEGIPDLDLHNICHTLVACLRDQESQTVQDYALTCIANLIDVCPFGHVVFRSCKLVKTMKIKFESLSGSGASTAIDVLSKMRGDISYVARKMGPNPILIAVPRMRKAEQRKAVDYVHEMIMNTGANVNDRTLELLRTLFAEVDLRKSAMGAWLEALPRCDCSTLAGTAIVDEIMEMMGTVANEVTIEKLMSSLCQLVQKSEAIAGQLSEKDLNYEHFLMGHAYGVKSAQIAGHTMKLMAVMLPCPPAFLAEMVHLPRRKINIEIGRRVAPRFMPIVRQYILTESASIDLALVTYGQCMICSNNRIDDELLVKMMQLALEPQLRPMVAHIALRASNVEDIAESGLFLVLSQQLLEEKCHAWVRKQIRGLEQKMSGVITGTDTVPQFSDLKELLSFMRESKMRSFAFQAKGLVKQAIELLRKLPPEETVDLEPLVNVAKELINAVSIPQVRDKMGDRSTESFVKGQLEYRFQFRGNTSSASVSHLASFAAIEGVLNDRNMGNLRHIYHEHFPDLSSEQLEAIPMTQIALFHRILKTPGYQQLKFTLNGKPFIFLDTMYFASTQNLDNQESYSSTVWTVECYPDDSDGRQERAQHLVVREMPPLQDRTSDLFTLMELIHERNPEIDLRCQLFENRMMQISKSVWLNASGFSSVIPLITKYPYLVGLNLKDLLLRLTSFDMFTAVAYAHGNLQGRDRKLRENRMFWNCTVRRDHLFEDGCDILRKFGPGSPQIDVTFDGEAGFGSGPTREFFELMAKELSLKSHNMWRTDSGDSPYAYTETGLFPRPDADPENFYVLGLLVAKAMAMNMVLPIPLSIAFFKLIGKEPVTIADVDPVFARSLESKDGFFGMPFTYPGIDSLELVSGGASKEVDESNVDEYIRLVTDFTCGSKIEPLRDAFNLGFHQVISHGIWELFTSVEKQAEVLGSDIELTMEILDANITFEHGYTSSSPQKQMLLETIMEFTQEEKRLFFKFVTGCQLLPIGGLPAVHPRISVARRIVPGNQSADVALPTASTCTNYFKMPAYSTKAILREKLLLAISEGQNAFLLS